MVLVDAEPVAIRIGFRVKKKYIKSNSWWNTYDSYKIETKNLKAEIIEKNHYHAFNFNYYLSISIKFYYNHIFLLRFRHF